MWVEGGERREGRGGREGRRDGEKKEREGGRKGGRASLKVQIAKVSVWMKGEERREGRKKGERDERWKERVRGWEELHGRRDTEKAFTNLSSAHIHTLLQPPQSL